MRFGSLFSGIGGIDLGLERAGMECAFQVENEPYCLKVLAKHWPNVTRYEDIREVDFERVERVDLLAGGFPCQDLSYAGKGAGLSGKRSGLWGEFVRAIRMVRPRYVLVENVPGLLGRGMGVVLRDLSALGYDAEWESVPAAAFGAPHLRWRVFIVAYTLPRRCNPQWTGLSTPNTNGPPDWATGPCEDVAHAEQVGRRGLSDAARWDNAHGQETGWEEGASRSGQCGEDVADASVLSEREPADETDAIAESRQARSLTGSYGEPLPNANGQRWQECSIPVIGRQAVPDSSGGGWWEVELPVGRVVDGFPGRVDQLRGLGNAVVPQKAEWLGRLILEHEAA